MVGVGGLGRHARVVAPSSRYDPGVGPGAKKDGRRSEHRDGRGSLLGGPIGGSSSESSDVTFNVTQSEKGQLWCSLDHVEFTTCRSPVHYSDLSAGEHTFEVYAVDAAGNQSLIAERAWTVA